MGHHELPLCPPGQHCAVWELQSGSRLHAAANTCLLNVWAVSRVWLQHAVHYLWHSRRAGVWQWLDMAAQDVPAQGVVVLPFLQK